MNPPLWSTAPATMGAYVSAAGARVGGQGLGDSRGGSVSDRFRLPLAFDPTDGKMAMRCIVPVLLGPGPGIRRRQLVTSGTQQGLAEAGGLTSAGKIASVIAADRLRTRCCLNRLEFCGMRLVMWWRPA